MAPQESVLPVLKQIAEKFRNRPDVLMKLINMEMSQSVEQVSPEGLYIVARAAAGASRYRSSQEQGMAVLSFARVLHYCGKPELAEIEAEKAVKILTGRHKKMAEAVRKHFSAINQFSRKIK